MPAEQNQLLTPDLPAEATTYEDGGNAGQSYTPPPPAQTAADDGEQKGEPPQWKDEKRGEIFARAREKRYNETQPFSGDPNDPDAMYGATVDQTELGELEREALRRRQEHLGQIAQPQPPQDQPKPLNGINPDVLQQRIPIKVDGETREVTIEELTRNYQIDQAASKRLEQAKALLQQTHEFQRLQSSPDPQYAEYPEQPDQDEPASDTDDLEDGPGYTSRKPANIKDLVEKIQLGTPDEAADALEAFVSTAVNRSAPVDETTRVLTALEDHNARQAVIAFAEQNPQIATNPILQQEATREIHRNMALDLVNAGYTMDQLRELAPSPQHLTQLHKQARIQGLRGVRRVSDLVSAGYQGAMDSLRTLVGAPVPSAQYPAQQPSMAERQQRKESLQPQPAARRLSPGMSAQSPARSQDQSRAQAVARIRQSRGQPV